MAVHPTMSRLYRRRFLQPNTSSHFAEIFETYTIYTTRLGVTTGRAFLAPKIIIRCEIAKGIEASAVCDRFTEGLGVHERKRRAPQEMSASCPSQRPRLTDGLRGGKWCAPASKLACRCIRLGEPRIIFCNVFVFGLTFKCLKFEWVIEAAGARALRTPM